MDWLRRISLEICLHAERNSNPPLTIVTEVSWVRVLVKVRRDWRGIGRSVYFRGGHVRIILPCTSF